MTTRRYFNNIWSEDRLLKDEQKQFLKTEAADLNIETN